LPAAGASTTFAGTDRNDEDRAMIELKVDGMTCQGCVRSVTKAVQSADPAATVEVDLATGRVRVETAAPRERVAGAIEAAGYDVAA
jgi:copper chaperone